MVLVRQNSTGTRDHNPSKMQGKRDNFTSGVCFPHVEIDPRTSLCSRRENDPKSRERPSASDACTLTQAPSLGSTGIIRTGISVSQIPVYLYVIFSYRYVPHFRSICPETVTSNFFRKFLRNASTSGNYLELRELSPAIPAKFHECFDET